MDAIFDVRFSFLESADARKAVGAWNTLLSRHRFQAAKAEWNPWSFWSQKIGEWRSLAGLDALDDNAMRSLVRPLIENRICTLAGVDVECREFIAMRHASEAHGDTPMDAETFHAVMRECEVPLRQTMANVLVDGIPIHLLVERAVGAAIGFEFIRCHNMQQRISTLENAVRMKDIDLLRLRALIVEREETIKTLAAGIVAKDAFPHG